MAVATSSGYAKAKAYLQAIRVPAAGGRTLWSFFDVVLAGDSSEVVWENARLSKITRQPTTAAQKKVIL